MPREHPSKVTTIIADMQISIIEGPFEFDPPVLISALRLATTYDYPALRTFAINKLDNVPLSTVERIRLAREFDLPSWQEAAYVELCERDDPITISEAISIGMEAFVQVASIREKEQRRKAEELKVATLPGYGDTLGDSQEGKAECFTLRSKLIKVL